MKIFEFKNKILLYFVLQFMGSWNFIALQVEMLSLSESLQGNFAQQQF